VLRLALNSLPLEFQKIFCRLQLPDHFFNFCNRCSSDFLNKWRDLHVSFGLGRCRPRVDEIAAFAFDDV